MKIKLDDGAIMPTRAHETDAGLDLYSREDKIIPRQKIVPDQGCFFFSNECSETFDTGVHIEIPHGYYGKIESKSGLNVKASVVCCGGVIDEGYTGSIVVKLYNFGSSAYRVFSGDKIAQLIIQPYSAPKLELVDELGKTDRGDNGFGSTGR